MQIGENLKFLRKMQGLTQQELAEKNRNKTTKYIALGKGYPYPEYRRMYKIGRFLRSFT